MEDKRNLTAAEAKRICSNLKDHHLARRKDIPEGPVFAELARIAFVELVNNAEQELVELLTQGQHVSQKPKEVYARVKGARRFLRSTTPWIYYPELEEDNILPKYCFARIAPRAIILARKLKEAIPRRGSSKKTGVWYMAMKATSEASSRAEIFSTGRLIKTILADTDLVRSLSRTDGEATLYNCEFWHYVPDKDLYYILSQAIIGVKISEIHSSMPIESWERATQRFWMRERGTGDLSSLVHETRIEIKDELFYEVAQNYPIIPLKK